MILESRLNILNKICVLVDVSKISFINFYFLNFQEEMFSDAPEHFLDPIMSILMRDPVKLPTSGQVMT